ncbi:unnamed protein product, partial [Larinioides sclopetarius]
MPRLLSLKAGAFPKACPGLRDSNFKETRSGRFVIPCLRLHHTHNHHDPSHLSS